MGELLYPGAPVLTTVPGAGLTPHRSTECSITLARHFGDWVCVDSHLPNRLAARAYRAGALGGSAARASAFGVRTEVAYDGERLDLLLEGEEGHTLVEVKSVTLVRDGTGLFPDAPTQRGARQLLSLATAATNGLAVEVLFIVQRSDAVRVRPNDAMDPAFGAALRAVAASGGRVRAIGCRVEPEAVSLGAEVPVEL
jgi:sugar fermentation stimulation protein A